MNIFFSCISNRKIRIHDPDFFICYLVDIMNASRRASMRREADLDLKIVVLGSAYVGKTSIINRYCNQVFNTEVHSTIGAGFFTHPLQIDDKNITVMIWDTAGDERFRSVTPSILRGTRILVLVFDLTQPATFSELDVYLDLFLDTCKVDASGALPVLLLGNKCDLVQGAVAREAIDRWTQKNRVPLYYAVSAKSGKQIEEAFLEAVKFVASARGREPHKPAIEIQLTDTDATKCC
jgi:small GTP-binding protein